MSELVEIVGLTKAYDERHIAVNNISLKLPGGKIIGLLGPNGSGKIFPTGPIWQGIRRLTI